MSSDTSAPGDIPALEPQTDRAAPPGRRAPDFAALAPDPAHDLVPHDPAGLPARRARGLTVAAAGGIGIAILIMIAASLVRGAWMRPPVLMPAAGPPWELAVRHVSADLVTYGLWLAALLGTGGVVAGLLAIHHGARLSARILLVAGLVTVAVLTVLPPAGSTDALDYATYGRLLALGHSPYVTAPVHLRHLHDAFARSVPRVWDHYVSVYGPLATVEQFLAARLGGASAARITFWLKLWDSAAFAIVALVLDRLLRHNPARRLRAHLLWTVNPLLLWDLVAAGHLDVLAVMAGLLGLLVLGEQHTAARPSLGRVAAAGALLGLAADIKIDYVLFGLGAAWALRRSLPALALAGAAALAVLVPSYAYFGTPAVRALLSRRNQSSADNFYRAFLPHGWHHDLGMIATVLVVAVAVLALRRLPPGAAARPAIRPAVALCAAWLFLWPYQLPWYDAMIICVLALFPASRLDWLVLARLTVGTISNMPGNPFLQHSQLLLATDHFAVRVMTPIVMLAAAITLVGLGLTGKWKLRDAPGPGRAAAGDAGRPAGGPGRILRWARR
ncbi:MAG: hypothetical protein JWL68_2522 [Actinomycetia bacterium]|nr:hypothetical protein [Actinomycetes bacterium]